MSFRFNFFDDKENSPSSADSNPPVALPSKQVPTETPKQNPTTLSTPSVPPPQLIPYRPDQIPTLFQRWTDLGLASLSYLHRPDDPSTASTRSSDLDAGVYEGGFVVWECTLDLLRYLLPTEEMTSSSTSVTSSPPHLTSSLPMTSSLPSDRPLRVLDLGCGAGLLGSAVRRLHPSATVDFQDFNCDVLKEFTIPNFHQNCGAVSKKDGVVSNEGSSTSDAETLKDGDCEKSTEGVRFISGDWSDISPLLRPSYDLILSAETIYSPASQQKIYRLLLDHLEPGGVAYFAAKRHYFGVGGGVLDFCELVRGEGRLRCEVVWSSGKEGLARDILRITAV